MGSVLIVDDDEATRTIVAEFLTGAGYHCTQADNVAQACRHLEEKMFELTISDFNMPSETGLDLLRYVTSKSPSTQFILMSGNPGVELREEALALGARAYMAKPFKLQELLRQVESGSEPHHRC